ncbi:MAG: glycosyl transferase [Ruminococcus sp.]|nr:glycosyl transferase [Ruminococcus sp.]
MIPKKIHYCWFGKGEKPKLALKCIESWRKYCPDYEIIEWNEDSFDINMNGYTKMCYENKKYAFLSDYVRLLVVAKCGGVYFDTDVELLKPLDDMLSNEAYFGFESNEFVNTGLGFGSVAKGIAIETMVKEYDALLSGEKGVEMCPKLNTNALKKLGLNTDGSYQLLGNTAIYPADYFNPYESATGRLRKTENTISVHWYSAAWMSKKSKLRKTITKPLHRIFGVDAFKRFRK